MVKVKNICKKDLFEVLRVEEETWPVGTKANLSKFESRLKIFPDGFIAAYLDNFMVGVSTSQIINYPTTRINSWEKITSNGMITSHNNKGNALYIVSIGVSGNNQGRGIGSKLLFHQIDLARKIGLKYLILGARIPDYHKNSDISIDEYVNKTRDDGQPFDREIRFYKRAGLKINKIIPNYMLDDAESLNYGVVMLLKI